MPETDRNKRHDSSRKFLKVAGLLWLTAILIIVVGALTAPYMGRIVDLILYQTAYRDWTRLRLQTQQPFFDLSTPQGAVKSYYSALYRGDTGAMAHLTGGAFHRQMQSRMMHTEATSDMPTYRSYLHRETLQTEGVVMVERFHLFWQRGLRFNLRRRGTDWYIVGVSLAR